MKEKKKKRNAIEKKERKCKRMKVNKEGEKVEKERKAIKSGRGRISLRASFLGRAKLICKNL